ncbi:MAG: adenylate/guanylate cyclase domain-containing protein [Proteobacteria bacterium]|nr:MAG: adenylate/guanylate cyclase domain-containing protein [Pseudomonadota bacterium]
MFAAFVALALIESQLKVLQPLEWRLSDRFARVQARHVAADPDIVIVDIDDDSLRRMYDLADRWPWPRSVHGELAAGIAQQQPLAIVFDMMFVEPDRTRPESDKLFNDLITPIKDIYFATVRFDPAGDAYGVSLAQMAKPLGMLYGRDADPQARANLQLPMVLEEQNWRLGTINFLPDADGIGRRYHLYMPAYGWKIPSLPARVANDLGYGVPTGESLLLRWSTLHRHVSYADLYVEFNNEKKRRDAAEFKNKIVIVGTAATGMYDERPTPLSESYPGVEVLATAIDNLKNGTWMRTAPPLVPVLTGLLLLAMVYLAFRQGMHPFIVGMLLVGIVAILLVVSFLAVGQRLMLPLLSPIVIVAMFYFTSALQMYLHERRERLRTVDFFTRFVNPHVVHDLLKRGGFPEKGEGRDITVLFSDIRGFTTLSETRTPEEIVSLLNRYFERQVEVIFRHGGCLDKFIGDAIMAFWGAPLDDKDHAKHAVIAALEMGQALEQFKAELKELGKGFDIGIGLNSGPAVVGLLGSENKREYTAIGDTVNVASRIEGLTKGVARVLVSEETRARCAADFEFEDRGSFKVKGREKEVRLFEPKGRMT